MNDKHINSKGYEWDIACDGASWNRVHNYEHHTYTNIIGKDRDFGYGLLRLSNDFRWRVKTYGSLRLTSYLVFYFSGVCRITKWPLSGSFWKKKDKRKNQVTHNELKKRFFSKGARQLVKDYILFPF